MLDIDTFSKGKAILMTSYRGFTLGPDETNTWYEIMKLDISDDGFIPLIIQYCRMESAPTCPADILNFGRKCIYNIAPSPTTFANDLITNIKRVNKEYYYSDISDDERKYHVINEFQKLTNPEFDNVIISVINIFFYALLSAIRCSENKEISFIKNEIKQTYHNSLKKFISTTILSSAMLELAAPTLLTLKEGF